jgi:hypothetical protein
MPEIILSIAPASGLQVPQLPAPVFVDVEYNREAGTDDAGKPVPAIRDVARGLVDTNFVGTVNLVEAVVSTDTELRFLSAAGIPSHRIKTKIPSQGAALSVELKAPDLKAIAEVAPRPSAQPRYVRRDAKLVPTGPETLSFQHFGLLVARLPSGLTGAAWTQFGLDKLFGLQSPATTSVQTAGAAWSGRDALAWSQEHLAVDGRFTAFFLEGMKRDGWLWLLTGPLSVVGFVLDDMSSEQTGIVSLPLPPLTAVPGAPSRDCPDRVIPTDVTEREVAENPQMYTEDPGAFCKPFSNPERVLGERTFNVIFRADQPVLSAEASITTASPKLLDFDLPEEVLSSDGAGSTPIPIRARVAEWLGLARVRLPVLKPFVILDDPPEALIADWRRSDRGRRTVDAQHPVQWDADTSRYQSVTVARGHILEYRMRWRSNGYSLGTVAKTLTLAPRQVKRIQKIEWQRLERTRREERTEFEERVEDAVSRDRQYDDAVQASLREWARGESTSSTSAGAGGFGFATAGFVIGGGGGHSNASTEASQEGGRRVTAAEEQRLKDTVRRYGDSLRRLESVVVSEVSQEETVTGTTEVVRNPNYGHSLSIIYYQILRHLKVETAFTAVRECLFVPFAIKPFTIARAYRWRDLIGRGLLDRQFAMPMRYLRDVLSGFAGSTVPPGRRSEQRIRHISGSLYLTIGISRPRDADGGGFDEAAWSTLARFMSMPARGVFASLQQHLEAQRDRAFQAEHAPGIASAWVDTLAMRAAIPLSVDLTLASRYSFNGTVRVDFSASTGATVLTREMLASIQIRATRSLPPGSTANLTRATVTYQTDTFQRTFAIGQGAMDLVTPETGAIETSGAVLSSVPDTWERQDVRAEMSRAVTELVGHLNEHAEHYHKVVWWNMDRDRLFMLVDGFTVPGMGGTSIGSVIERDPIAIMGNAIVFRVSAGSFLGFADLNTPAKLHNYYASRKPVSEPILISLPTDGLYAQAIMDECSALEEHRGSTEWVLEEKDPELPTIGDALLTSRRAEPQGTTPTPFPQTLINLQNATEPPQPAGLAGVLNAVTNAGAFRDMAGLAGTQANARAAFETAANLATQFASQAAELRKADMGTQSAKQKLDTISTALDKGLIDEAAAKKHADRVLGEMNTKQPSDQKLTQEQSVRDFLSGATEVTATRADAEGQQTIQAKRPGGNDPPPPPLDLDLDRSLLGWTSVLRFLPESLRSKLEENLSVSREAWLTANRAQRQRLPNEPATNLDGLPIPPWVVAQAVFDVLRTAYAAQHAALTQADQNLAYSRTPDQILGANPANACAANYFVVHDTAGTNEPSGAGNLAGVHLWIGTRSLARGGDWDAAGDATKLEFGGRTCFVHVELTRATSGSIANADANTYPNVGISTARSAGTRYTDQQYDDLANAYIVASIRRGRFLTVTAHKELDRSAVRRGQPGALGHGDPEDVDIARVYRLVASKLVLPADSTFGITQQRIDSRNLDGQVNAFVAYARGSAAVADQYGWPVPWQQNNPAQPQGDSTVPPYSSTDLYIMPLQDTNGNNVLHAGNGNWETGGP